MQAAAYELKKKFNLVTRKEMAFDVLFNRRHCLLFMLDKQLCIDYVNPYCSEFLGVDTKPVTGKYLPSWFSSIELISPIKSNETDLSERAITRSTLIMGADAKLYRVHWEWVPIKYKDEILDGYLLIGTVRSFMQSKKQQTEKSLHAKEFVQIDPSLRDHLQQCADHYDHSKIAMAWKNTAGKYVGMNETFLQLFQSSAKHWQNSGQRDISDRQLGLNEEQCQKLAQLDEALLTKSLPSHLTQINYDDDGTQLPLTFQAWPYFNADQQPACLLYLISYEKDSGIDKLSRLDGSLSIKPAEDNDVIENALRTSLEGLTKLMQNTLNTAEQDPVQWRCSLETILIQMNQFKTLLSLPHPKDNESQIVKPIYVKSLLENIAYTSAYSLMLNAIEFSTESILKPGEPIGFLWSQAVIQNVLIALITPCIEILHKGSVTFKCNPRQIDRGKQVFALAMKCTGVNIDNRSIRDVAFEEGLEDPLALMSKKQMPVSSLQWVMAHRLFESMGGYTMMSISDDDAVIFTFCLPSEDYLLAHQVDTEKELPSTIQNNKKKDQGQPSLVEKRVPEKHVKQSEVGTITQFEKVMGEAAARLKKGSNKVATNSKIPRTMADIIQKKKPANENDMSILLVEDNVLHQRVMLTMFDKIPCNMDFSCSAKETRRKFLEKDYDLILLDIGLPDSEGLDLARTLRALEKKYQKTKATFCVVSAHPHLKQLEGAVPKPGEEPLIQTFFTKPFMPFQAQELYKEWKESKEKVSV
jgi:CheY-like chemotaxis protein